MSECPSREEIERMAHKLKIEWRRQGERDAYELMHAGWLFEVVNEDSEPWQWYWRRPGPRGGRLFRSTSQALNQLKKDRGEQ